MLFRSQYSEEYVVMDAVPVAMNLSKSEELMLKRNYPAIASKLYGSGISKKLKFTLNNNDVRHNFATLKDATQYALGVYKKRISDINVQEEFEIKVDSFNFGKRYLLINVSKSVFTFDQFVPKSQATLWSLL